MKAVKLMIAAVCVAMVTSPRVVYAWDGVKSGKITEIDVTDGQNFGFRVHLDGTPMCGTSEGWAYMNRDWDNYDTAVAILTSAYLSGKSVIIHTYRVGIYCKIGYVILR